MKRIPYIALLACGLLLAGQQQASAWSKYNFGVGLNVGWEGGGNSVLWAPSKALSPLDTPMAPIRASVEATAAPASAAWGRLCRQRHRSGLAARRSLCPGAPMGMPTSMPQAMPMPQTRQMPRADAEPVGYFYPTYPAYPQYLWYYGNGYGY